MKEKLKRWRKKLKSEKDNLKGGFKNIKVDDMSGKRGKK